MAPRRNAKAEAAVGVSLSPRRTRSGAAGKREAAAPAPAPAPVARPKKKVRLETPLDAAAVTGDTKCVIIEACKQCNAFKTRALKVQQALQAALPAFSVSINPLKPRRGCFEIRQQGGPIFISLLNMPRPFTPMKNLDMDHLIQDIINKLA